MMQDRKVKVLCVEDEQDIRENIADILRDENFEVFEAGNGREGFEAFVKNKPDIIISDIMMPEVDGYGLLKMVRESKNVRNNTVPFIFLTALGQKESVIKGVEMSANDYLVKPIDFELMIAKVKEKTANAIKVQEKHNRNITNLKSQFSVVLPTELMSYLDIVTQVSTVLKEQPYGPFPHRRYLEDIEKINLNALKIRSAITNALDEKVIDNKLNTDEEIFAISHFISDFINNLSEKFKNKIELEPIFDEAATPRVKVDRLVLTDAFRKILSGILKSDLDGKITISVMLDHLDQMVLIFYLNSAVGKIDLNINLNEGEVSKILDKQNCRFEITQNKENTAVLTIPSYRLVNA
jgi:CheY-like chemotaxis protein